MCRRESSEDIDQNVTVFNRSLIRHPEPTIGLYQNPKNFSRCKTIVEVMLHQVVLQDVTTLQDIDRKGPVIGGECTSITSEPYTDVFDSLILKIKTD